MPRCVNNGIMTIKPGNKHIIWSDESSFMLSPTSGRVYMFGEHPKKPTIWNSWFNSKTEEVL
jgi:hypothetical protein